MKREEVGVSYSEREGRVSGVEGCPAREAVI